MPAPLKKALFFAGKQRFEVLPVQFCNMLYVDTLGTGRLAFIVVAAVAEAFVIHGFYHIADAPAAFHFALWQFCQMGNLG